MLLLLRILIIVIHVPLIRRKGFCRGRLFSPATPHRNPDLPFPPVCELIEGARGF